MRNLRKIDNKKRVINAVIFSHFAKESNEQDPTYPGNSFGKTPTAVEGR
jgi:hypothetical protein